jgi:hypothetical protein
MKHNKKEIITLVCFSFMKWLMQLPQCLIITNKQGQGLKELRKFVYINGIKTVGEILNMEVSQKGKIIMGSEG